MRSFLQKKAGATYFSESNVTASIRKHNLELYSDLQKSSYPALKALTKFFYD